MGFGVACHGSGFEPSYPVELVEELGGRRDLQRPPLGDVLDQSEDGKPAIRVVGLDDIAVGRFA
jgi:hypothetical protein